MKLLYRSTLLLLFQTFLPTGAHALDSETRIEVNIQAGSVQCISLADFITIKCSLYLISNDPLFEQVPGLRKLTGLSFQTRSRAAVSEASALESSAQRAGGKLSGVLKLSEHLGSAGQTEFAIQFDVAPQLIFSGVSVPPTPAPVYVPCTSNCCNNSWCIPGGFSN